MKKLIPLFLAGAFVLTGVEALANNVIENAEFANTQLEFNDWSLELDRNILSVQLRGSEDVRKFVPLEDLLTSQGHRVEWDSRTNTLEITTSTLNHYQQQRELHPIVEPIDMDNIDSDEWFNWWLLSNNNFSLSHGGVLASMVEHQPWPDDFHLMDSDEMDYWFENHFDHYFDGTIFESVIGCNAEKIRVINYMNPYGFSEIKFNLQDVIDSGIFSDEEIEELLENIRTESQPWSEERMAQHQLEDILSQVSREPHFINILSDEQLEQLAEMARAQMSNE